MLTSHPIEVDGRFLGVAVTDAALWRFIATDPVVEDLDGARLPTPAEAARVARLVEQRNRQPPSRGQR